jgi:hypothetical protein
MKKVTTIILISLFACFLLTCEAKAQSVDRTPTLSSNSTEENTKDTVATASSTILEDIKPKTRDLTQETESTVEPLRKLLDEQELGPMLPKNPIKYAIRGAINHGVPPNTIVLLLLLPGVAALIAAARHLVGIRGFGIFLPAALSVVFVATGPVVGIGLFLIIVIVSTLTRIVLRRSKIKLQYLPRMALLLHFVVLGILVVLFSAPLIKNPDITNVSIFPVLILVLLAEDFSRVQLGKSARVAVNLTSETLILALVSYIFLTLESVQEFALLNPESWMISIAVIDFLLGRYVGLRFLEFWKFRKLITSE